MRGAASVGGCDPHGNRAETEARLWCVLSRNGRPERDQLRAPKDVQVDSSLSLLAVMYKRRLAGRARARVISSTPGARARVFILADPA